MSSITVQEVTDRNFFKYNISGMYCVEPSDVQRNSFMVLMKEIPFIFYILLPRPELFCKVFEDNQILMAVVESKK